MKDLKEKLLTIFILVLVVIGIVDDNYDIVKAITCISLSSRGIEDCNCSAKAKTAPPSEEIDLATEYLNNISSPEELWAQHGEALKEFIDWLNDYFIILERLQKNESKENQKTILSSGEDQTSKKNI